MPLRQVAHAAVQQLGRARRGAVGPIARLQQGHALALQRRLHRHPEARGTPTDHQHIPMGIGFSGRTGGIHAGGIRRQSAWIFHKFS